MPIGLRTFTNLTSIFFLSLCLGNCSDKYYECTDVLADSYYWEDPSLSAGLNSAKEAFSSGKFQKIKDSKYNIGYSKSAHWFYYIPQFPAEGNRYWLVIENPLLDFVDLSLEEKENFWKTWEMGDHRPYMNRILPIRPFALRLTEPSYRTGMFVRVQSEGSIRVPLAMCRGDWLISREARAEISYGLFFGSILFIGIYHLISYFYSKKTTFLTFAVYSISLTIFIGSQTGHLQQYFYPDRTDWNNYIIQLSSIFVCTTGMIFIYSFFPFLSESKFYKIIKYSAATCVILLIPCVFILRYSYLSRFIPMFSVGMMFFFLVTLFQRKNLNQSELWVRRGILIVFFAILVSILRLNSILPNAFIIIHALKISQFLEILCFALATGSQYNLIQQFALTTNVEKETALKLAKSKTEILSYLSHEIRSPIHSIMAYIEILSEKETGRQSQEELKYLQRSAEHVVKLVSDILDQSRLEAGKIEIHKENFHLSDLIDDISGEVKAIAAQKNLSFVVNLSPDLPKTLYGDSFHIHQVLTNLLSNAVKFTKEGTVTLSVSLVGEYVQFSVIDSGLGIKEDEMAILFSQFSQANRSIYKKFGGTGLGLSICRGLLVLMNSELKVKTELEKGSEFYFLIRNESNKSLPR
ncbi:sensor histidine kinase [Leptospira idonii]|uniref:histidine kinase n=1 Tax=Leptospira idonii TaxID=1193500 RepID=A0A4R9LZA7_9LEPT|nr:sensor histidine kinase [Leptospira idonii]TGN17370.1 hybrid sensor histidine kinase/response regulator [Leptospira idonii]